MSDNDKEQEPHRRGIRSFVMRTGRVTAGQARALQELGARFIVPYQPTPLDLGAAFGRDAPTIRA